MNIFFTLKSRNSKTGPIPVSTTSSDTCPSACPLRGHGCYAESGPLWFRWLEVTTGKRVTQWSHFLKQVSSLPAGTLWRHNQAGDLPGQSNSIDVRMLRALVHANRGRRGFTYTHKPMTTKRARDAIAHANQSGFTINLSANNLAHADILANLEVGPVVTVLPSTINGNIDIRTPASRRVVVCPATYRDDVSCASCQLCQRVDRTCIVGFPAHGARKYRASAVASE